MRPAALRTPRCVAAGLSVPPANPPCKVNRTPSPALCLANGQETESASLTAVRGRAGPRHRPHHARRFGVKFALTAPTGAREEPNT